MNKSHAEHGALLRAFVRCARPLRAPRPPSHVLHVSHSFPPAALWKRKKTGVAKPSSGLLSAKPPNKRKARQLQKLLMHARNDAQRELLAAGVTKGDIDRMLLDGETSKKAAAAAAPKAK